MYIQYSTFGHGGSAWLTRTDVQKPSWPKVMIFECVRHKRINTSAHKYDNYQQWNQWKPLLYSITKSSIDEVWHTSTTLASFFVLRRNPEIVRALKLIPCGPSMNFLAGHETCKLDTHTMDVCYDTWVISNYYVSHFCVISYVPWWLWNPLP